MDLSAACSALRIRTKEREQRRIDAKRRKEEKWEEEREEILKDIKDDNL